MNIITLTGRSAKDVELKFSPSGSAIGNGTIAVRRDFKNKQTNEYETDFINFVALGKTAEIMADYVKKGDQFGLSGRLQIRIWNKDDGTKQYFTEVIVSSFDFPNKKNDTTQNTNEQAPIEVSDDSLPF